MPERTREEHLEDLVVLLYADATRAGGRVTLPARADWDLLHEVQAKAKERANA